MQIITKLEAAHRQIEVAIRMYMAGGDIVAIHTLACSAREIYEKHCLQAGIGRMFDQIQASHPDEAEKALWAVLNGARNFFKHPDPNGDLNAKIELSDHDNKLMLFCSTYDCSQLCKDQTPLIVQAYNVWIMATEPDFGDGDCLRGMEMQYPGIGSASPDEQRSIGCRFIDDVLSGKICTASIT